MKPVIQEEMTGCGIASVAAIAGTSYVRARAVANRMGIHANDENLWCDPNPVRQLLLKFGIESASREIPFKSWDTLPDCALLATKWHLENGKPYWHWAVFVRDAEHCYVLDSKLSLKHHLRTDFGRIKPKWYIEVLLD
ncbi:MAG: hypothetical protein ACWA5Q_08130 [bacterium]